MALIVRTSLVDMYAKNRCLDDAELLFSEMNERDLFSWTVNIANYAQTDHGESGKDLSPMNSLSHAVSMVAAI